ncbi:GntR family transcriptional regulator, partial [Azospirillum brasilense]|nr:GntR family transcriptional regulator [Azospirillum brasilense]
MPADLSDLMLLPIDRTSGEPLLRQVYDALRRAILSGALPPGGKLPPTRAPAERPPGSARHRGAPPLGAAGGGGEHQRNAPPRRCPDRGPLDD